MYDPKVNPLSEDLFKKISTADWNSMPLALIGFDVYVDIDGNVGFYEGNSSPFALGDYKSGYGNDLELKIAGSLKERGIVGINIDLNISTGPRAYNGGVLRSICQRHNLPYIMADESKTRWDKKKKKFYFKEENNKNYFDVLFNRCPSAHRRLRKIVPESDWKVAPVVSPITYTLLLANKKNTSDVLKKLGIETPLCYIAKNEKERKRYTRLVMKHIEKNHPNYQAPFILVKPVCGTGARKVRVFRDANSNPSYPLDYPCLVSERITPYPIKSSDGTYMADTRMFYFNGFASHGIVRIAPKSVEKSVLSTGNAFSSDAYITNLCRGGSATRFEGDKEKIVQQYVLAAAFAINQACSKGE